MSKIIEFETFTPISSYGINNLTTLEPTCFNGVVKIHKFKITIEPIDEPKDVLCERLQDLWDKCDNYHHWTPIKNMAKKIGYELKGEVGSKRKKS